MSDTELDDEPMDVDLLAEMIFDGTQDMIEEAIADGADPTDALVWSFSVQLAKMDVAKQHDSDGVKQVRRYNELRAGVEHKPLTHPAGPSEEMVLMAGYKQECEDTLD